jgi:hypothetical protein
MNHEKGILVPKHKRVLSTMEENSMCKNESIRY